VTATTYNVPDLQGTATGPAGASCDSLNAGPFYSTPVALNTGGATTQSITDEPNWSDFGAAGYRTRMYNQGGVDIVEARYYDMTAAQFSLSFIDWATVAKLATGAYSDLQHFAQTSWSLNVNSANAGQQAVGGTSAAVTSNPVTTPITNTVLGTNSNYAFGGGTTAHIAP
jgi:hypothetical protein